MTPAGDPAAGRLHTPGTTSSLFRYVLALRAPLATGRGPITHRRGLLVRLRDPDGHDGWGEAAPLPGWRGPDLAATAEALADWLRATLPVDDAEALAPRAGPTLRAAPCAWAAIGGAVADLAARRRGITLAAFLADNAPATPDRPAGPVAPRSAGRGGGKAPAGSARRAADPVQRPSATISGDAARGPSDPAAAPVATAALLDGDTPPAVAAATAAAVAEGYGTVKLKVGSRPLADDVARVAALREAAPRVALRLDANGAWGAEAPAAVEALERFGPELVEEPCRGLDGLRSLQARTIVPIAADESLPPLDDLHRHLPLGVAAAVLKPSALGDPAAVLAAADDLRDSGTDVIVGSFLESAVGLATAAHVAAAAGGPAAGLGTSALLATDVCPPPVVRGGALWPPPGAGLGLAPDPAGLAHVADIGA